MWLIWEQVSLARNKRWISEKPECKISVENAVFYNRHCTASEKTKSRYL